MKDKLLTVIKIGQFNLKTSKLTMSRLDGQEGYFEMLIPEFEI